MRPPLPRLTSMILLCTLLSAFASLFRSTHLMCYQVFSSPLIFGLHTLCAFCVPRLLRYAQVVCVLVVNAVFLNLRLANLWSFSVEAPPYGHTSTAMHDMSVSGSGHTGKQVNSFDTVIHMQESPPHKRFLVGCSSPCNSPNTLRRFALGASDVCLVGENPTCSAPALWTYDYGHA